MISSSQSVIANGFGDDQPVQDDLQREKWNEFCRRHDRLKKEWLNKGPKMENMSQRSRYGRITTQETFRCFQIPEEIHLAVIAKDLRQLNITPLAQCRDIGMYQESLKRLLEVEEVHQAIEMRRFDQMGKKLVFEVKDKKLVWYGVFVPGLTNRQPSLVASDYVILEKEGPDSWAIAMQITNVMGNIAILPQNRSVHYEEHLKGPLNISFISSGITFISQHQAVEELERNRRLRMTIFDEEDDYCYATDLTNTETDYLESRIDKLNDQQRQAIEGILRARCGARPYILFGPPGTGKTHTLTEAVYQIHERSSKNVLVCANSNTCADHLYVKLSQQLPKNTILRLKAGDSARVVYYGQRVVVTTNIKASSLSHQATFNYVFIDEAGHANEPEALIPISLLKHSGCLVLAGDPKQLGPVVMCWQAGKLGLDCSLLDRIFKFEKYQRNSETKEYNKDYITKLLRCYRCDPSVLATSNKLFYENELECVNTTPKSILNIMQLNQNPVQLKPVYGIEWRPQWSTSWANKEEVSVCVDVILRMYKMGFTPDQIGVITPYRLQGKEIFNSLRESLRLESKLLDQRFRETQLVEKKVEENVEKDLIESLERLKIVSERDSNDPKPKMEVIDGKVYERMVKSHDWMCKIDTVDAFQGNEREVIIISTVRTSANASKLDFLNDARRFNVAISRAKWLLIIIGDPDTLNKGKYWPELMNRATCEIAKWPARSYSEAPFQHKSSLFKNC